jgi:hypothetical protein
MRHYTQLLRATVTALLMLAVVAGAAVAGPFEDAKEAYDKGDFPTALRLFVRWLIKVVLSRSSGLV